MKIFMRIVKIKKNHICNGLSFKSEQNDEKNANKRLHEKSLGPIPEDLLYSHCQIRLNSKNFVENSENTEIKGTKICCKICENVLGDYSEKDEFVQIWHHTVILNDETEIPSTALETFLLLIGGICADHDWIPLKIRLKSEKTDTEGNMIKK